MLDRMRSELAPRVREGLPRNEAGPCSISVPAERSAPGPGQGRLAVALVEGASAVVGCASAPPLHLFTPRARGRSVSALVAGHGGGLLAGDVVELAVEVGPGAVATVGTQADTRVYRSEGPRAVQRVTARLGAGAALGHLPEPTRCFAGARYRQEQRFDLEPGASLLLLDALTPGRSARGERWAFDEYLTRNEVHLGGRLVLRDALRLLPGEGPGVAHRMRSFELLATVVALGPAFAHAARAILERVGALAVEGGGALRVAASPLLDGLHLRLAARSVEEGQAFVHEQVALASPVFGRDPLAHRP